MDKQHLMARSHQPEPITAEDAEDRDDWRRTSVVDPSPEGFTA